MTFHKFASERKSIALIDTDWGGHHSSICKLFAKILLELGHSVIVFCPEPIDASKWLEKHSVISDRLRTLELQPPEPSGFSIRSVRARLTTLAHWRNAASAIRQIPSGPPYLTFFPWLDDYLLTGVTHHLIDRVFPYAWSGLYFHPRHLRIPSKSIFGGLLAPYSGLRSAYCRAVAVLDEGVAGKLEDEIHKHVIVFPDVADAASPDVTFPLLADIRRRARGRKIVGLLGSLEIRKGILTLLEAALTTACEPYFYVFAGAPASEGDTVHGQWAKVRSIVNTEPENCFFHFQRIPTEEQFNAMVDACDLVFAAYLNFPSSSNLLSKAAIHRKPLIVSEGYCMGERVRRFGLGATIPEGDVGRCIEALHQLLDARWSDELRPDFAGYLKVHSLAQLIKGFEAVVEAGTVSD
jgi:glycosyltransferase involved in cell wall biosynthesis